MISNHDLKIQEKIFNAKLKYNFNKDEISLLSQRINNSDLSVEECIIEAKNRRHGPEILCGIILCKFREENSEKLNSLTLFDINNMLLTFCEEKFGDHVVIKAKTKILSL